MTFKLQVLSISPFLVINDNMVGHIKKANETTNNNDFKMREQA
jgi:hypothetical protein